MTRLSVFNSPLLLGFEHFERTVDRVTKSVGDGYPPYNIERIGPDRLRITVAVAGFGVADLSITVEDNQLIIRGKQADEGAERVFIPPRYRRAPVPACLCARRGDRGPGREPR